MKVFNFFLSIILSFLLSCESSEFKYTLSASAIFQNESPYIKEWIEYHKLVGVEHFILYNNNSTDDYLSVLNPYIEMGWVDLIEWPSVQQENDWHNFSFTIQTGAYTDSVDRFRGISKWVALIDIDEFIIPVIDETISETLERIYPHVSGLNINWQCYGTGGVKKLDPSIPMISQLNRKMLWNHDWNRTCKSIVQPLHVKNCTHPHFCIFNDTHWGVDSKFRPTQGQSPSVEIDVLRINHYWCRDEWFMLNVKLPRYEKWGVGLESVKSHADSMNQEEDLIMKRFTEKLKERI